MVGLLNGGIETVFGGSGWYNVVPQSSDAAASTSRVDTKENVRNRLLEQGKNSWDFGVKMYNSPLVQRPMGVYSLIDGVKTMAVGFDLILIPWPSLADEIIGFSMIVTGFLDTISGIKGIFPSGG